MADVTTALQQSIVDPATQFVNAIVATIPGLVAAILLVIFGYLAGVIIGKFVQQALERLRVDERIENISKVHPLGKVTVAELCGKLVKWYLSIAFLAAAAQLLSLGVLSGLLTDFALWAPHLIAAVIIMAIGFFLSELVKKEIQSIKSESSRFLGIAAKYIVLVYFALIALGEIGLNVFLAQATILIVIAGIMLAFAIGFGLALKDHAEQIFAELKKTLK
ncbi:MAG TPA: hypothetical protein HA254_07285 [Candidatus Diapherotrites archaeon]|uniref:Mechanosensitive ion channel n=1 Tax=Candidatus Iainarchaeum sp. TaxID=3101447 RepID=A0A7J4J1T6_9ARCH|nr:hypothetical protein [Candidatus Diapherotrites archaeon]